MHIQHMNLYTECVVAVLGSTGYAGLAPGKELDDLLVRECALAEKVERALSNPTLAKVTPPLTPAQKMWLATRRVMGTVRELIIAEARETIKSELSAELSIEFDGKIATAAGPKSACSDTGHTRGGGIQMITAGAGLANNPLYAKVTESLSKSKSTAAPSVSARRGVSESSAERISAAAQTITVDDISDDENADVWADAEAEFFEALKKL
jgi:hypothetical protein